MAKKVFFCGIGGSGMSGLARYFLAEDWEVFGSDTGETITTEALQKEGCSIIFQQSGENITSGFDLFIYSEAISEDHEELLAAQKQGIDCQKYAQALGEVSKKYYTIAVAGTHGKSSTTSMLATILRDAGKEVTSIVGANINDWGGKNFMQANKGASEGMPTKNYLVIEACEYRDSFQNLDPNGIVVTNIEPDHLDYFGTEEKYFESFQKFLGKLPQFGFFVSFLNGENMMKILPPNFHPRKFDASDFIDDIPPLQAHGIFQQYNAATAIAAATAIKIEEETAKESVSQFTGLSRRFEMKGTKKNILVIDDYAHHPTAVTLTLQSAREYIKQNKKKKLWVVFQPHQFSRTANFYKEFIHAFKEADEVLIPNIYECRDSEEIKAEVTAEQFAQDIENHMVLEEKKSSNIWGRGNRKRGEVFYKKQVRYTRDFENTVEILNDYAYDGDVIVVIGAGDVYKISTMFLEDM